LDDGRTRHALLFIMALPFDYLPKTDR